MVVTQRKQVSPERHEPTGRVESTRRGEEGSGLLWRLFKFTFLSVALLVAFAFLSSPLDAETLEWVQDVPFEGQFAVKRQITAYKSIALGGPECVAEDDEGNIYTGLQNGNIMKIQPHHQTGRIGEGEQEIFFKSHFPSAPKTDEEATHGRPLGLRIRNNKLFVVDCIYGIYTVDLQTREAAFVLKLDDVTPHLTFPDDMDITADGRTIYFSDATSRFTGSTVIYSFLEGKCTGRLYRYNVETKQAEMIKSDLCFANGIQLNEDETVLVVAETLACRVSYFRLADFKLQNQLNLPAMPDNIRRSGRKNFWIAASGLDEETKYLNSQPFIRTLIAGLVPYSVLVRETSKVKYSLLIETDDAGNVLRTYHEADNTKVHAAAHVSDLSDGRVAIGTYMGKNLVIATLDD